MNAKEMFEDMGYALVINEQPITLYQDGDNFIKFLDGYQGVEAYIELPGKRIPMLIDGYTLEAIHQQMKELGWIE